MNNLYTALFMLDNLNATATGLDEFCFFIMFPFFLFSEAYINIHNGKSDMIYHC